MNTDALFVSLLSTFKSCTDIFDTDQTSTTIWMYAKYKYTESQANHRLISAI